MKCRGASKKHVVLAGPTSSGGDTNSGSTLQLTGCAVGVIDAGETLSRVGCQVGDALYCSGPLGSGNAFAINRFLSPGARYPYAPVARIREGRLLRGLATACMDTSDGVLATLDQLMRVNTIGFSLDASWASELGAEAHHTAQNASLPAWLLLAGQHGEFELLFTVAPRREEELHSHAASEGWQPKRLGSVTPRQEIHLEIYGDRTLIDTARIRNAAFTSQGIIREYIQELMSIDEELQKGNSHHDTF